MTPNPYADRALEVALKALRRIRDQERSMRYSGRTPINTDPGVPRRIALDALERVESLLGGTPDPTEDHTIPLDYWREVPCQHPDDPTAVWTTDGRAACHCAAILDPADGHEIEGAPGPIVVCEKCGCTVAVPPRPTAEEAK